MHLRSVLLYMQPFLWSFLVPQRFPFNSLKKRACFRGVTKGSGIIKTATALGDTIVVRLTERVLCSKSQVSLMNIYFRLSGLQASILLLLYCRNGPNICSHCTKVWHKIYPICDAPLSRSTPRASLKSRLDSLSFA